MSEILQGATYEEWIIIGGKMKLSVYYKKKKYIKEIFHGFALD